MSRFFGIVGVALLLGACSADATRLSPASLGLARPACAPGTFAGSMSGNCPQPVR